MEKRYPADFARVRPWGNVGDRKNDGYLKSKRQLFQLYAPNELTAAVTIAKIEEDFTGALPHWKEYFDTWILLTIRRRAWVPISSRSCLIWTRRNRLRSPIGDHPSFMGSSSSWRRLTSLQSWDPRHLAEV